MSISINGNGITSANIADGAITNADIADDAITDAKLASGGGKVLQVVQGTTSTDTALSTTAYVDTGLSASITPTSTSSKILVLINQAVRVTTASAADKGMGIQIVRDATIVYTPASDAGGNTVVYAYASSGSVDTRYILPITYLDSPTTTSAITYKTQAGLYQTTGSARVQSGGHASHITLMEIGV